MGGFTLFTFVIMCKRYYLHIGSWQTSKCVYHQPEHRNMYTCQKNCVLDLTLPFSLLMFVDLRKITAKCSWPPSCEKSSLQHSTSLLVLPSRLFYICLFFLFVFCLFLFFCVCLFLHSCLCIFFLCILSISLPFVLHSSLWSHLPSLYMFILTPFSILLPLPPPLLSITVHFLQISVLSVWLSTFTFHVGVFSFGLFHFSSSFPCHPPPSTTHPL